MDANFVYYSIYDRFSLYKDNHVRACVYAFNFFFKKNFSLETIDWTFTKFHSSVPYIEVKIFIVIENSGLWSDTGAQAPLVHKVRCMIFKIPY